MSGLEAEPGPGRAEAQPGRPAGFAGRAQPAPSAKGKGMLTVKTRFWRVANCIASPSSAVYIV